MFALVGLLIGIIIGLQSGYVFPQGYSVYVAIGILACLDSVLGGIRSTLDNSFRLKIFVSGFFGNGILSIALIWLGNKLNIQLSIAAVVVFGSRLFQNFAYIRRHLLDSYEKRGNIEKNEKQ
ncbi:MAG: small basic family protein [Epulopiscium sp.]|nr:small basic family protein [Candidatus Epulonipiscium sp.]